MKIRLTNGNFEISDKERAIIKDRLHLALGRFSLRIGVVKVKLSNGDVGDKGLKKCRIEVLLRPPRKLVAEDANDDLQLAVDRAATQMAGTVERKRERDDEK